MEAVVERGARVGVAPGARWLDGAAVADETALWMAWEGARQAWLDGKRRKSGATNTARAYEIAHRQFFEWCGVPPWQVSAGLAQAWAGHLGGPGGQGLAETSVCLKLAALASFYGFVAGGPGQSV
jgi:hypothetical protein